MQLSPQQTERFYRIWFALLHHIHTERQLAPNFPDTPGIASISPADAQLLRNTLWADDSLRETFIAKNPAGLPPADLAVVASWQYRVSGNFFVMRYLKKYTVFLSTSEPAHAYGVLGLVSPLEDVVGPFPPIYVQAVLLPFEDHIIYDSLLMPYPVTFGSGIRGDLNETYRNAQEREGIITTLGPAKAPANLDEARKDIRTRNAKILSAFRKNLAQSGLSIKMVEQHAGNIEAFAQTYLLTQNPPRGLLDITLTDVQAYLRTTETATTSFKRFVRFLTETGRMDYEQATPLRNLLK